MRIKRLWANGGKPPLVVPEDPNEWPSEFVREKVVVELDKQSLRNAIAEGKKVPGCYIAERGFHLSIR